MKKISLVMMSLGLAASAANAAEVTIQHNTAGALAAELTQAITDNGLSGMSDITGLIITGEAAMNATDFAAIRSNLRPSLLTIDLSQAVFTGNKLPGGDYDKQGLLQTMNIVECKLPETLTGLSGGVFFECKSLEHVNLPDGIRLINQYCFSGCTKLQLEALPSGLTAIAADAFKSCAALTLTELPATIKTIGGDAFNESGVAFTTLPRDLEKIGERTFRKTNCTFSEWPEKLTEIPGSVFSATKVAFKELSPNITSVGTYAFQSVKTMAEFTIPDQANLWTKIPDGCFFVQTDDVKRTFICRAPAAPKATVNIGSGAWSGSFSQVAKNPNTTFKVLASAMESFQNTAPYNTMNIEALTTPVTAPVIVMPEGIDPSACTMALVVNGQEHTDFSQEVLEGEGLFVVKFAEEADANLYVEEIRYSAPVATAEGEDEGETEPGEDPDPDLLYMAGTPADNLKKQIEVPVNVTPGMAGLQVKVAKYSGVSAVENIAAENTGVTRQGDMIYLTAPGADLYNVAGKLVASSRGNTIDLSGIPGGVYILRAGKTTVKILK